MLASSYANDAKTFLKHFSDCLFYFCSTCADSITENWQSSEWSSLTCYERCRQKRQLQTGVLQILSTGRPSCNRPRRLPVAFPLLWRPPINCLTSAVAVRSMRPTWPAVANYNHPKQSASAGWRRVEEKKFRGERQRWKKLRWTINDDRFTTGVDGRIRRLTTVRQSDWPTDSFDRLARLVFSIFGTPVTLVIDSQTLRVPAELCGDTHHPRSSTKAAFTPDTCSRIQVSRKSNLYPDISGYKWIRVVSSCRISICIWLTDFRLFAQVDNTETKLYWQLQCAVQQGVKLTNSWPRDKYKLNYRLNSIQVENIQISEITEQ